MIAIILIVADKKINWLSSKILPQSIDYKFLAAAIVEYKKAKEISLDLYPEVIPTLKK